jgi:hypothetical protein
MGTASVLGERAARWKGDRAGSLSGVGEVQDVEEEKKLSTTTPPPAVHPKPAAETVAEERPSAEETSGPGGSMEVSSTIAGGLRVLSLYYLHQGEAREGTELL